MNLTNDIWFHIIKLLLNKEETCEYLCNIIGINKNICKIMIDRIKPIYVQFDRYKILKSIMGKTAVYKAEIKSHVLSTELIIQLVYRELKLVSNVPCYLDQTSYNINVELSPEDNRYYAYIKWIIQPDIEDVDDDPTDPASYIIKRVSLLKKHETPQTLKLPESNICDIYMRGIRYIPSTVNKNEVHKVTLDDYYRFLRKPLPDEIIKANEMIALKFVLTDIIETSTDEER